MPIGPEEPGVGDPAERTRLAWTRTALGFAAIGAVMLRWNLVAGVVVLVLALPVWAAGHRVSRSANAISSADRLRLVTVTVLLVAAAALAVVFLGPSPGDLTQLLHLR